MELENVVPWGRSCKEYREMFSLSETDLNLKILGCSDGPAGFNAEATKAGKNIQSVDPVYQFSGKEIRSRIDNIYPHIMSQVGKNRENFVWKNIADIKELGNVRMRAMELFLDDYEAGKAEGRYINASLPNLPFEDDKFDLALCSHYLFLYSDQVNEKQHIKAIKELCRIAKEVRIYPLLSLDGRESKHLKPAIRALDAKDIKVSMQSVNYQFQKGATTMLVVKR